MSKTDNSSPNRDSTKDINELLSEYTKDATHFIATPATIDQMVKDGLKLDKKIPISQAEYIENLFAGRKEHATELIKQFPTPPSLALPPITSLYDEIRECMLFGLNGAAITLSAVLVEFALKHAIVDHIKGVEVYDKNEWDRIEGRELGKVINEAAELKLFDEDEVKRLITFKDTVRNPYLHYNIKKITADMVMSEASAYDLATKRIVKKYNLKAEDNPFLWQLAKKKVDEEMILNIFLFADSVVKKLFIS